MSGSSVLGGLRLNSASPLGENTQCTPAAPPRKTPPTGPLAREVQRSPHHTAPPESEDPSRHKTRTAKTQSTEGLEFVAIFVHVLFSFCVHQPPYFFLRRSLLSGNELVHGIIVALDSTSSVVHNVNSLLLATAARSRKDPYKHACLWVSGSRPAVIRIRSTDTASIQCGQALAQT